MHLHENPKGSRVRKFSVQGSPAKSASAMNAIDQA
jgi:hypothetical protein